MCLQLRTVSDVNRLLRRARLAEEKGEELLETALVVSILFMLLIGIIWFGRGYNIYETITRAAREGARFATTHTCATCGNTRATDDEVRAVVIGALQASNLDPANVTPNPISVQWDVTLNPGSYPTETGVVISFGYPMRVDLPFTSVNLTTITVTTSVQMREEI